MANENRYQFCFEKKIYIKELLLGKHRREKDIYIIDKLSLEIIITDLLKTNDLFNTLI